jgi:thiamine pyrophosphokinase
MSGRLDHTIHTLSYLHKLRKYRQQTFAVSDDNVGWILDEVNEYMPACGVGVAELTVM